MSHHHRRESGGHERRHSRKDSHERRHSEEEEQKRRDSVERRREAYERDRRRSLDERQERRHSYDKEKYVRRVSFDPEDDDDASTPNFRACGANKNKKYIIVYPPPAKEKADCKPIETCKPIIPPAVAYQPYIPPPPPPPPCPAQTCPRIKPRSQSEDTMIERKRRVRVKSLESVKSAKKLMISEGTGQSMAHILEPVLLAAPPPPVPMISEDVQTSNYALARSYAVMADPDEPVRPIVTFDDTDPGLCPFCHKGYFVKKFTWSGIVASLVCFPCGIIACFCMRVYCCSFCGESPEGDYHSVTSLQKRKEKDKKKAEDERKAKEVTEQIEREKEQSVGIRKRGTRSKVADVNQYISGAPR